MKTLLLILAGFGASVLAQEATASSAVEGVRGVRQEGSGKVKEIDPAAKNVAPTTVQGVDKVDGVKAPARKPRRLRPRRRASKRSRASSRPKPSKAREPRRPRLRLPPRGWSEPRA